MLQDESGTLRCPQIRFSEEEVKQFYKPWSKALVVRVLEKSFGYLGLRRRLEYLWAKGGRIQVSDLSNDYFLVRFSDVDDYHRAAFQGPWKMYDYYITVARWTPSFNEEEAIQKILTWVRLPKLPIHFFNHTAVNRIGNHIGKTIRMDLATAEGARARYARVCVEIDLSKPLLGKYMIGDRVFYVEYESIENICYECGFYGHKIGSCPSSKSSIPEDVPSNVEKVSEHKETEEGDTGSWMVVTRKQKKRAPQNRATSHSGKGNKFTVLNQEVEHPDDPHGTPKPTAKTQKVQITKSTKESTPISPATTSIVTDEVVTIKWPLVPRTPLGDVTNSSGPPQGYSKAVHSQECTVPQASFSLVQVPVTSENPIFYSQQTRGNSTASKRAAKGKSNLSKALPTQTENRKSVQEGRPKVKSFKLHGFDQNLSNGNTVQNPRTKMGRPPDASQ
ncbi:hypothetical protein LINPERHAP2_LOCUS19015 [Linum perenne]